MQQLRDHAASVQRAADEAAPRAAQELASVRADLEAVRASMQKERAAFAVAGAANNDAVWKARLVRQLCPQPDGSLGCHVVPFNRQGQRGSSAYHAWSNKPLFMSMSTPFSLTSTSLLACAPADANHAFAAPAEGRHGPDSGGTRPAASPFGPE